jgi:SAM-dependent methyltransferase
MPQEDRLRSLSRVNELLKAAESPESALERLLESKTKLDVLEVGFGYGRALLELAWRFRGRNVTFHGVDLTRFVADREALRDVAAEFEILPQADLATFELPHVHFYDATALHFGDESLDFVYSVVTVRFIRRKAEFLEEVCRVLRPGGYAMLHVSESHWDYPYSVATDERILTPYTNRFVLKFAGELIPLPAYLKLFEGDRFRFEATPSSRCILRIWKQATGRLSLHLDYDEVLSMSGRKLPLRNRHGEVRGGFRSVYNVRPEHYAQLFERGLLSRDELQA